MASNAFEESIVDELCDTYEVEQEDAIQAVHKAKTSGLLPAEDGDAEKVAETVYSDLSLWGHV